MNPFPELSELSRFFESEPVIGGGPGEPWFYNVVRFVTVRNGDRIECDIEPGEYIIRLQWFSETTELLDIQLENVYALEIENQGEKESMRAHISYKGGDGCLILQLRPFVHVSLKFKGK